MKSHKFGLMQNEDLNNDELMLRGVGQSNPDQVRRSTIGMLEDIVQTAPEGTSDTIFAVNSDF